MKVSDIERGEASILELKPVGSAGFEQAIASLQEVSVVPSEIGDDVIRQIGNDP